VLIEDCRAAAAGNFERLERPSGEVEVSCGVSGFSQVLGSSLKSVDFPSIRAKTTRTKVC
jgi:hypothetical protein